jgi:predicted transposase YbfD/YdcC
VKGNQPWLFESLQVFFSEPKMATRNATSADRHGNRRERRRVRCSSELNEYLDWPGLAQVVEVTRWSQEGKGAPTQETRYAITSLSAREASAKKLLGLIRGHWGIENKLHYVRDVTYGEDQCTVRTARAPRALAAVRNFAIGLFHGRGEPNIAAALRTNAAKPRSLLQLITTPPKPT